MHDDTSAAAGSTPDIVAVSTADGLPLREGSFPSDHNLSHLDLAHAMADLRYALNADGFQGDEFAFAPASDRARRLWADELAMLLACEEVSAEQYEAGAARFDELAIEEPDGDWTDLARHHHWQAARKRDSVRDLRLNRARSGAHVRLSPSATRRRGMARRRTSRTARTSSRGSPARPRPRRRGSDVIDSAFPGART